METDAPRWFKSSYSSFAHDCVEVAFTSPQWSKSSHSSFEDACLEVALIRPGWFKSSHSSFEDAGCVEVAFADRPVVLVRDTQNREDAVLDVGTHEWSGLVRLLTA